MAVGLVEAGSSTVSALKQPMAPVAVLFAAGIVVGWHLEGDASPGPIAWAALLACARSLCPSVSRASNRRASAWLGAGLVLAGWADFARQTAVQSPWDLRARTAESAQLMTLHGTLLESPRIRLHGVPSRRYTNHIADLEVMEVATRDGGTAPLRGRVRITTPGLPVPGAHGGGRVAVSGVLQRPPSAAAPGLFDPRRHLATHGVYRELRAPSVDDWRLLDPPDPSRIPWADRFQDWAKRALARGSPGEDDALRLLWAMTLGWKTALVDEVEEPFLRSGTMHIFAISGLHVALIANIVVQVLRLFLVPRFLVGLAALPIVWLYVAATGWQSSAVRAAVMSSLVIGSWMCSRPVNLLNSLATAAFAVLAWDPIQLLQAGFQLSFAVVAGIGMLAPQIEGRFEQIASTDPFLPAEVVPAWRRFAERLGRRIGATLAVSVAAWVASVPLAAWYFHLVTPVGLLANCIVVPLSSCALASSLACLACSPWFPWLGECFAHGAWFWMAGMLAVSRRCAELPYGSFQVAAPPIFAIALAYTAILLAACGALATAPGRRRAGILVTLLLTGTLIELRFRHVDTRIGVLPIRGGQCLCVQTPAGMSIIDTGDEPGARTIVHPYLRARGVNQLREIWLTHGDIRHVGGTFDLLDRYAPASVRAGPLRFRSGAYRSIVDSLASKSPGILRTVRMGDSIGGWQVLHPAADDKFPQADDGSLVLRFGEGPESVLIVGDLGRPGQDALLRRHPGLRAGIVISGLPTRGEPLVDGLLDALQPRMVIIVDAAQPAPARASGPCKSRLRARLSMAAWFTSETGGLELRRTRGRWELRDAEGRRLGRLAAGTLEDGTADLSDPSDPRPDEEEVRRADGDPADF
ncbi:MAG: ComEC/Rec2 family competence protein [Limisphaerales bacterium]